MPALSSGSPAKISSAKETRKSVISSEKRVVPNRSITSRLPAVFKHTRSPAKSLFVMKKESTNKHGRKDECPRPLNEQETREAPAIDKVSNQVAKQASYGTEKKEKDGKL